MDLFGNTESEFVWMKNPGNLEPTGKGWTNWKQNLLIKGGPDVFFTMHNLNNGDKSYSVIVTGRYCHLIQFQISTYIVIFIFPLIAELWSERLMLYYVEDVPGAWGYPENIHSIVIDSDIGTSFEANFVDLNADGNFFI